MNPSVKPDERKSSCSSNGPKCPRCGFTFTPDERHYYDQFRYTEDECQDCGCKFKVEVNTTTSWRCETITDDESRFDAQEPK